MSLSHFGFCLFQRVWIRIISIPFPGDFEARYGHCPLLLESFVDTSHYTGTCYRAANWQYIGRTKGRGRQDVLRKKEESISCLMKSCSHRYSPGQP
ncbi:MAG: DUF4338 domain-containing protein [Candidatus Brocadia sp.]|nr:DUF4338 domain-containing protein [Candidatus Brocadia sp.]